MEFYRHPVSFRMKADYYEKLKFIAKSNNMYVSGFLFEIISQYIDKYEDMHGIILTSDTDIKKW